MQQNIRILLILNNKHAKIQVVKWMESMSRQFCTIRTQMANREEKLNLEVCLWLIELRIQLVSMRIQLRTLALLSGLSIWCC